MLSGEKMFCLTYADDMVLLAENEEGMVHMLGKMEGILFRYEEAGRECIENENDEI